MSKFQTNEVYVSFRHTFSLNRYITVAGYAFLPLELCSLFDLTLSVPHFPDCSKTSLPNRSGPYWSNPPFFKFLTFGLSGAQD